MALRKRLDEPKKRGSDSGVEPDRGLAVGHKEQRDHRIGLFLRDFDHQAKDHLQEMKKELASLLQMAEQAFQVETLALPVAMRKMRRKDLIGLKEEEAAAATIAASLGANDCGAGHKPNPRIVRTNSKRVKVTTIVEYKDEKSVQGKKSSQKVFKTNSLGRLASNVTNKQSSFPRSTSGCSTPNARTLERSASMREQPVSASKSFSSGPKRFLQRGFSKSVSVSERAQANALRTTSMPHERSVPFVNIPLADGQTLCSAGADLQNIDVELLNDDTVQHIHTLVNQLTVLCGKATVKSNCMY